jgi:hypothetical protein
VYGQWCLRTCPVNRLKDNDLTYAS